MSQASVLVQGTPESRRVCLRHVMKDPVAFRGYFVPQVSRRRFWQRYHFAAAALAIRQGDATVKAGRGSGKSYSLLEPEIVQPALTRPGEETLLTSFRRLHIVDRMERAIDYFETVPLLKIYLDRVLRSPQYTIILKNAHTIYGISVGDDPEAKMAQGKHASTILVEEAHQYPARAYIKLEGATDPRGFRTVMVGVPDGRMDTPFRQADTHYSTFKGRRIKISRRHDPYWNAKAKQSAIDKHGSETADTFRQEVDAEWGRHAWSAWNLDAIEACVDATLEPVLLEVAGPDFLALERNANSAIITLPGPARDARRLVSLDVGYSQPSMIGVWEFWKDRWWMIARIRLVNRMEHDDQATVIDAIARKYEADRIGVDTTEGEGRAIVVELEKKEPSWLGRIDRVTFSETALMGWKVNPEDPGADPEEVHDILRSIATIGLRRFFAQKFVALPRDEEIPYEFNKEVEIRSADGKFRVLTPDDVHITDMMRVFAVMLHFANPPQPPNRTQSREFALPEIDDEPSVWASRAAQLVF